MDNEQGALWAKLSEKTGDEYYTGTVYGHRVVMFRTDEDKRKQNPKLPMFRIYECQKRE